MNTHIRKVVQRSDMLNAAFNLREVLMHEPVTLAHILTSVIDFVRNRGDAVVHGGQAVNVYVEPPRGTEDVDLLTTRAEEMADEIKEMLAARFHIAVRVRPKPGGFQVYQLRRTPLSHRKLVDVRRAAAMPAANQIDGVLVLPPDALIASKVISYVARKKKVKGPTDLTDLRRLLLTFPELKMIGGSVDRHLRERAAGAAALACWRTLVADRIEDDDAFPPDEVE